MNNTTIQIIMFDSEVQAVRDKLDSLDRRIRELEDQFYKHERGIYASEGFDAARKRLHRDPTYRQLKKEEDAAWTALMNLEEKRVRGLLEGVLPSRLPQKRDMIFVDNENPIFTKGNGVVNIRPIATKQKRMDARTAMLSIAEPEKGVERPRPRLKSILHDHENGVDVATDGKIMLVVPCQHKKTKKTWIEGRDGQEIHEKYPRWQAVIPEYLPNKFTIENLQTAIDQLAGIKRASMFVRVTIFAQAVACGTQLLFHPEDLLRLLTAMQSTGSGSVALEFSDAQNTVVLRDVEAPQMRAVIIPENYENYEKTWGKTLIAPINL
jgi:hypothetical protein